MSVHNWVIILPPPQTSDRVQLSASCTTIALFVLKTSSQPRVLSHNSPLQLQVIPAKIVFPSANFNKTGVSFSSTLAFQKKPVQRHRYKCPALLRTLLFGSSALSNIQPRFTPSIPSSTITYRLPSCSISSLYNPSVARRSCDSCSSHMYVDCYERSLLPPLVFASSHN